MTLQPRGDSVCPICGKTFRSSWPSFQARWPRWLAVFLAAWLLLVIWFLTDEQPPDVSASTMRAFLAGCAAIAWMITLTAWVFFEAGRDARNHKACLQQMGRDRDRRMWLAPPLFALALVVGAAILFGMAYMCVWGLESVRHLWAAWTALVHRLCS